MPVSSPRSIVGAASDPSPPGYYRVRSGDTLSEIAERKRLAMRKLAAWNDLKSPYPIYAGSLLRVKPPAAGTAARPGGSRAQARRAEPRAVPRPSPVKTSARKSAVVAGSDGARPASAGSGP